MMGGRDRDNGYGSLDDQYGRPTIGRMGDTKWEQETVVIIRPPNKGFGLAISGGIDRPYTADNDPSIVISDVLPGGPAEGKLQVNDRVISVNGQNMERVRHEVALNSLRKSGNKVIMVIARKTVIPPQPVQQQWITPDIDVQKLMTPPPSMAQPRQQPTRSMPPMTTTDAPPAPPEHHQIDIFKNPSEGYGMRLGWKLYVQGLNEQGVAAKAGVKVGDKIDRINDKSAETMSLEDVRKEIELSQETMALEITREGDQPDGGRNTSKYVPVLPTSSGYPNTGYPNGEAPISVTTTVIEASAPPPSSSGYAPTLQQNSVPAPQRPPSPRGDFANGEPVNDPEGEDRHISYVKGKSVGLRLVGGNEVGIYVAAIQPGSQAETAGIAVGDRIKEVNDCDLRTFTKEDVLLLLLTLTDEIRLTVVHSRSAFRKITAQKLGDKFFIRTHFSYEPPKEKEVAEMGFRKESVFRIVDTLPGKNMGYWDAVLLSRQNTAEGRGLIPNKNRAEQIGYALMRDEYIKPANMEGRGGFFKRRGLRASMATKGKPVIKDHWDEVIFSGRPMKYPAYERVVLRKVDFKRPVVIFGPTADIARKKLLENFPQKFESPITQHSVESMPGEPMRMNTQGNVKLSAIRDIMDQQKHCVLDITPNAVEQLNYHQLYPIVIFLNAENRSTVKAIRGQYYSADENKGSRKLYQTAKKVKSSFAHIFTAMIPLQHFKDHRKDQWFNYIQQALSLQQDREIWISESRFEDEEDDDELPVIGDLALPEGYDTDAASSSYASGNDSQPESDQDIIPGSPNNESSGFDFTAAPAEPREELPQAAMVVPPASRYESDDDTDQGRRSRPRQKKRNKKDTMGWARERSRSRSRDRRSELGPPTDDKDETDEIKNSDWRGIIADRHDTSWEQTARPSRKEQIRKKEEEKRLARTLARESLPGMTNGGSPSGPMHPPMNHSTPQENHRPEQHPEPEPRNTRPTAAPPAAPIGPPQEAYPEVPPDVFPEAPSPDLSEEQYQEEVVKVEKTETVESAPPPRGGDGYQQSNMYQYDDQYDSFQQPYSYSLPDQYDQQEEQDPQPYSLPDPDPYGQPDPYKEEPNPYQQQETYQPKTFRPSERSSKPATDSYQPSNNMYQEPSNRYQEPDPYPQHDPYELTDPYQQRDPYEHADPYQQPDPYEQTDPPYGQPDPYELHNPYEQQETYQPDHYKSTSSYQSSYSQPDPYDTPTYLAEKRESPFGAEKQSQQESLPPPSTTIDAAPVWGLPDGMDDDTPPTYVPPPPPPEELVRPAPAEPVYAKVSKPVHVPPPKPVIAPKPDSTKTETWTVERKVVSVTSSLVTPEIYKVDLQNGEHEELDNPFKAQKQNVQYSSAPPPTRSAPTKEPEKPKVDTRSAREKFFLGDNDPTNKKPGVNPYQPDKESYRAFKESRNKRSQSPGRKYQEKAGLYGPKGWAPKKNQFQAVPVSEEAFNSDEGQEVVATARGTFTSRGGTLESRKTGVSIKIPAGAIPPGVQQEVYFKVCRDNNLLPPLDTDKGETLLSPLVMCGPHGLKFQKPVELNLPHTAANTPDGWSFNLKSSDTPAGEAAEWKNMSISDKAGGGAAVGQKTVSVMVEHF